MQFVIIIGLFFLIRLQCSVQNTFQNRQSDCECGKANPDHRVVGGTETTINKYPWMAAIVYSNETLSIQFCGGSLITPQHVLSAAHCFVPSYSDASNLVAYLGDHDLSEWEEADSVYARVESIIMHPEYNRRSRDNDVALLVLKKPVPYSVSVRPICMPPDDFDVVGQVATVAGWGRTSENGKSASKLQEVSVNVYSNDKCNSYKLTDNMICAGNMKGGEDSCAGDSGGPLFYNCDDEYIQIGVVSFGLGCGRRNKSAVYANVARYLDFITENIEPHTLCPTSCSSY